MSSLVKIFVHVTFHTKLDEPWLTAEVEAELLPWIGQILLNMDAKLVEGGCFDNHVHLLLELPPKSCIEDVVRRAKGSSSHWLRRRWPELKTAGWQQGFAAFSVDYRNPQPVIDYIRNQRSHHAP